VTVILVRHAESTGNTGGTIQGWTDTQLTDAGREQARSVATRLGAIPLAAIYASPLARARDTAQAIADASALAHEVVELPELRERNYGLAQGLTWIEAQQRWPARASHELDWATEVPEVESMGALRARGVAAVSAMLDRHSGEVAVCVSHGGTLVQVIAHLFGLPTETWPRIRLSNTSVTVVEGTSAAPVIRTLNDVCHLDDAQRAATLSL